MGNCAVAPEPDRCVDLAGHAPGAVGRRVGGAAARRPATARRSQSARLQSGGARSAHPGPGAHPGAELPYSARRPGRGADEHSRCAADRRQPAGVGGHCRSGGGFCRAAGAQQSAGRSADCDDRTDSHQRRAHRRGRMGTGGGDHRYLCGVSRLGRTAADPAAAVVHRTPVPELDALQRQPARHGVSVGGLRHADRTTARRAQASMRGRPRLGRPPGPGACDRRHRDRGAGALFGECGQFGARLGTALPYSRRHDRLYAARPARAFAASTRAVA